MLDVVFARMFVVVVYASYTAKEKLCEDDMQTYKIWLVDHSLEDNLSHSSSG